MMNNLWWRSLMDLLFPRTCCGCGERLGLDEQLVCSHCQMQLPLETNHDWLFNRRRASWSDHPCVANVAALTRYERTNISAQMVHNLKFFRRYELGGWMGRTMVQRLCGTGLFEGVDYLLPIPLSAARQRQRGFNQAEAIARGISEILGIPVRTDLLRREASRESQTHFNLSQRMGNAAHVFKLLRSEGLEGKHIMLIDDVITTGTTMLGAIEALEHIPGIRISVFAWAWAHRIAPVIN
ncbi:MAG: hypothetical protein K6G70_07955 [Bacteroidaceae bacterium]|nr:hypothetical protein [Bacteroidaceae bacterium]